MSEKLWIQAAIFVSFRLESSISLSGSLFVIRASFASSFPPSSLFYFFLIFHTTSPFYSTSSYTSLRACSHSRPPTIFNTSNSSCLSILRDPSTPSHPRHQCRFILPHISPLTLHHPSTFSPTPSFFFHYHTCIHQPPCPVHAATTIAGP